MCDGDILKQIKLCIFNSLCKSCFSDVFLPFRSSHEFCYAQIMREWVPKEKSHSSASRMMLASRGYFLVARFYEREKFYLLLLLSLFAVLFVFNSNNSFLRIERQAKWIQTKG